MVSWWWFGFLCECVFFVVFSALFFFVLRFVLRCVWFFFYWVFCVCMVGYDLLGFSVVLVCGGFFCSCVVWLVFGLGFEVCGLCWVLVSVGIRIFLWLVFVELLFVAFCLLVFSGVCCVSWFALLCWSGVLLLFGCVVALAAVVVHFGIIVSAGFLVLWWWGLLFFLHVWLGFGVLGCGFFFCWLLLFGFIRGVSVWIFS